MSDLASRLSDVEDRLTALESRQPSIGAAAEDHGPDPDPYWALAGLKSRVADHSAVLFAGTVNLGADARHEWQQGTDVDALLDADWTPAADVVGALGHPVRLTLLHEVLRGLTTVAQIGSVEGLGTSGQLYHHLRQLTAAGWLRSTGRGRYGVPAARVIPLLVILAAAQR